MRALLSLAVLVWAIGCGANASPQNADRSIREFQLAASLRQEGSTPGAIKHLRTAIELDPGNAEAQLLMGFIQMERGDYENAREHLKAGVDLLVAADREGATLAEARNIYGRCLIELKEYDEASEVLFLSATDELNTAPHLAYGNLAIAHLEKGDPESAVDAASAAVRLQSRFCVGYYTLGRALFELDKLEEAERALVSALEADPQCTQSPMLQGAWKLRGEVRARLGHQRDAKADLEQCIELGPHTDFGRDCQRLLSATR